eukprot:SAG31_NODE_2059_length_6539_cov_4.699845_7_plen_219_part_00
MAIALVNFAISHELYEADPEEIYKRWVDSFVAKAAEQMAAMGPTPEEQVDAVAVESPPALRVALTAAHPLWVSDTDRQTCADCGSRFSLLIWQHHCRNCGDIFCSSCSRNSIDMQAPQETAASSHGGGGDLNAVAVRVCDGCFQAIIADRTERPVAVSGGVVASAADGATAHRTGHNTIKLVDELTKELASAEENRTNTTDGYFNAASMWHLPNLDAI